MPAFLFDLSARLQAPGSALQRAALRRSAVAGALALALALGAGCAAIGREFPVAAVDQIVIGKTTRDDIQRLFGTPWRVGVEDGKPTWTYGHYRYKLFGRAKSRDLLVRFDEHNVVASYTFSSTELEDRPQR
jgi:hypothetical protein